MFVNGSRQNEQSIYIEDLPYVLPTKIWLIWPSGFRGKDF